MGARSGNNYLSTLKKLGVEVWFGADRVTNVTSHESFSGHARLIASLYDMQMERPEAMTFRTDDGGRAGLSFAQPGSAGELRKCGVMMKAWAEHSCGFLEHTPDRANRCLAVLASAHQVLSQLDPHYERSIGDYYRNAYKFDWCIAMSLPERSRAHPDLQRPQVDESAEGIVVNGRVLAPMAPFAEELLVFTESFDRSRYFVFAVPCKTQGLSLRCEDPFATLRSVAEYPLTARFGELECSCVFDNVKVPRNRVFISGEAAQMSTLLASVGLWRHLSYQKSIRNLAKIQFLLGVACIVAGNQLAQMMRRVVAMRESLRAAENDGGEVRWSGFTPSGPRLDEGDRLFSEAYSDVIETIVGHAASRRNSSETESASPEDQLSAALSRLLIDVASSPLVRRQAPDPQQTSNTQAEPTPATLGEHEWRELTERVKAFLTRPA